MNSILHSSARDDWLTPVWLIEAARTSMVGIDLDPASTIEANKRVKAKKIFTKDDDGLRQAWFGNVWLNPPYGKINGKSSQGVWVEKAMMEIDEDNALCACVLVNLCTGDSWFRIMWEFDVLCFLYKRVRFELPCGSKAESPRHSSVVGFAGQDDYLGSKNVYNFMKVFKEYGRIVQPDSDYAYNI